MISSSCVPQTYEITAPWKHWDNTVARASVLSSLVTEYVRNFSVLHTYLIGKGGRRIPFDPGADSGRLESEYRDTYDFMNKQLKVDPRMKPRDIEVKYDHLNQCTSCKQRQEVLSSVRGEPGSYIDVGKDWQLLVDDWVVHSWRNIIRFLNPPESQQVVMEPPLSATKKTRFGCPCSVVPSTDGRDGYRVYHTAGATSGSGHRNSEWPMEYVFSSSADGISDWDTAQRLKLDGFSKGVSGSFTASLQRGSHAHAHAYVAGYEGANSRVCLARSKDGNEWTTVPTSPKKLDAEKAKRFFAHADFVRPLHLTKKNVKVNLRVGRFNQVCKEDIRRCRHAGVDWGGGLMQACILDYAANNTLTSECRVPLTPFFELLMIDCEDGTPSRLGRAGDCNVQPIYDERQGRQLVWYRRDFGTSGGWREIRGVQVVELNSTISNESAQPPPIANPTRRVHSYYLDRLGKLERFRRQIYSVTLTRHSADLWLGLMTVIEWAKDMGELAGDDLPAFQRDTTSVYLVTSRDGVHLDDEWVYARRPLLPKGKLQKDWNSGFQLAADRIVTDYKSAQWRVYFEARKHRHEDRFKQPGVIGMASWRLGSLVGLRAADPTSTALLVTKPFKVTSTHIALLLNLDTNSKACGISTIIVEILDESLQPLPRSLARRAVPILDQISTAHRVQWKAGAGVMRATSTRVPVGVPIRFRFTLTGTAKLFAFRVLDA